MLCAFLLELGQTSVQSPSQFCSRNRAPEPPREELAKLSEAKLGVPSLTNIDLNQTPEENERRIRRKIA